MYFLLFLAHDIEIKKDEKEEFEMLERSEWKGDLEGERREEKDEEVEVILKVVYIRRPSSPTTLR